MSELAGILVDQVICASDPYKFMACGEPGVIVTAAKDTGTPKQKTKKAETEKIFLYMDAFLETKKQSLRILKPRAIRF